MKWDGYESTYNSWVEEHNVNANIFIDCFWATRGKGHIHVRPFSDSVHNCVAAPSNNSYTIDHLLEMANLPKGLKTISELQVKVKRKSSSAVEGKSTAAEGQSTAAEGQSTSETGFNQVSTTVQDHRDYVLLETEAALYVTQSDKRCLLS